MATKKFNAEDHKLKMRHMQKKMKEAAAEAGFTFASGGRPRCEWVEVIGPDGKRRRELVCRMQTS
ncbi:MAG TPA: hypothetical protein VKB93_22210 [Thermoanaerobaculia bacterium]|nr:hypothetical protein [Thermoanaerobaculia bacterium]